MVSLDPRPAGAPALPLSPLTLGTSGWSLRSAEENSATDALAADFAAGRLASNVIDTSNIYGDGHSEVVIGRALGGSVGAGLVVQTKLDRDAARNDFSAAQMEHSLRQSLDRLDLESVDVLFLHDPENVGFDSVMQPGGAVEALVAMRDRGVARAIGISGGPVEMMRRFVDTGIFDVLINHNRFTLVDRSATDLYQAARDRDMIVENAAPFGGGVLTGDPRFAGTYAYGPIRPETQAAVDGATRIAAEAGIPLAALALQFSLRHPLVDTTVVGVRTRERFDEAVVHAAIEVPDAVWAALDTIAPATGVHTA
ncbi:aldo/keto reductase [Cryobacterium sp.]|jgi:D-threo-aldose 1-dehydrogenase|uniref:aldo/keto reductase n=1 Tax=Cryobacterium sp. TaxID=1926290 RepID=UPI002630B954|nr:aldo/keto reductase [Cryobacterium sp.]MCU1445538.1 oxidoreductase [Cryobacterium sp.]